MPNSYVNKANKHGKKSFVSRATPSGKISNTNSQVFKEDPNPMYVNSGTIGYANKSHLPVRPTSQVSMSKSDVKSTVQIDGKLAWVHSG